MGVDIVVAIVGGVIALISGGAFKGGVFDNNEKTKNTDVERVGFDIESEDIDIDITRGDVHEHKHIHKETIHLTEDEILKPLSDPLKMKFSSKAPDSLAEVAVAGVDLILKHKDEIDSAVGGVIKLLPHHADATLEADIQSDSSESDAFYQREIIHFAEKSDTSDSLLDFSRSSSESDSVSTDNLVLEESPGESTPGSISVSEDESDWSIPDREDLQPIEKNQSEIPFVQNHWLYPDIDSDLDPDSSQELAGDSSVFSWGFSCCEGR